MELHSRILMGLGAALEASTDAGRRPGGWTRLARVRSLGDAPKEGSVPSYVIAVREVSTAREYQLGCSCPDWIHRKSHTGQPCKHQTLFLSRESKNSDPRGLWLYRAGQAFLGRVQGK